MNSDSSSYAEMATIIARFANTDAEGGTAIPGLFLGRGDTPSHPIHTTQWPCLALVIQGEKSVTLGGETYHYGVGDYLIVSLDLPVISRVTLASRAMPYLGLGLSISSQRLQAVLNSTPTLAVTQTPRPARAVAVNKAEESLLDAALRLLRLLDTPDDIAVLAPLIEQEILYRLLQGPAGSRLVEVALMDTPGARIARAISWLRETYTGPLKIDNMARRVGMSVSSLHHHFKTVTAMTPLQYQKRLRLHEARRLMIMERLDVGSAGYAVGYQSASQFSREYSRHYGVAPSRDAAALDW